MPRTYKGGADAPIRPVPSFGELAHVDSDVNLDVKASSRRSPSPLNMDDSVQMRHRHQKGADMATLKSRFDPVAGNSHRSRRASLRKRYDAEGKLQGWLSADRSAHEVCRVHRHRSRGWHADAGRRAPPGARVRSPLDLRSHYSTS